MLVLEDLKEKLPESAVNASMRELRATTTLQSKFLYIYEDQKYCIYRTFGDNDDGVIGIDTKQGNINVRQCPRGQKSCCDPIGNDIFSSSEFPGADDDEACSQPDVVAVQDFAHGVTCGKRDSRVYYDAGLPRSFTNP